MIRAKETEDRIVRVLDGLAEPSDTVPAGDEAMVLEAAGTPAERNVHRGIPDAAVTDDAEFYVIVVFGGALVERAPGLRRPVTGPSRPASTTYGVFVHHEDRDRLVTLLDLVADALVPLGYAMTVSSESLATADVTSVGITLERVL